jgi:Primase C terminal 1 (PriCT-1)
MSRHDLAENETAGKAGDAAPGQILVSRFTDEHDTEPRRFRALWEDVAGTMMNTHRRTPCAPCPGKHCRHKFGKAFNFAEQPGGRKQGVPVLSVHAGAFDLDHGDAARIRASVELLKAAEVECVMSTTHSHKPQAPRWRLVIRLSRPVLGLEWSTFWAAVDALFQLGADTQAKDPARIYFEPTCPEGATPLVWRHQGTPLDVDQVLRSAPPALKVAKPKRTPTEWAALVQSIGEGGRNSGLFALAGHLFHFLDAALAAELVRVVNAARCAPPLPDEEVATLLESMARRELAQWGGQ